MVGQYPHQITFVVGNSDLPFVNSNGDWDIVEPTSPHFKTIACRAEMNGNNRTIAGQDSSKIEYSFVIYLPKTAEVIDDGRVIEVKDGERMIVKSPVKQFHKGQLNCKLYV